MMKVSQTQEGSILRIVFEDNSNPMVELTYYGKTKSVGITHFRELKTIQKLDLVLKMRKIVKVLEPNTEAWCKTSDSQTNKLLKWLGFSYVFQKMGYNKYCYGNSSSSSRS